MKTLPLITGPDNTLEVVVYADGFLGLDDIQTDGYFTLPRTTATKTSYGPVIAVRR